ncbi:MAG: cysteine desulfurase [Planctomycetaceae bacterium]|jgi:cysteine desulfurase|nr:cysteine desulfurase [Planctomycetaceae bacterium]
MPKLIYADNAATKRIYPDVFQAMSTVLLEDFGNPSAIYDFGGRARNIIESARVAISGAIGANVGEVYFTSGGTEADNWAIKGTAAACLQRGKKHIISTAFEHHAVLESLKTLQHQGFDVTYIDIGANGIILPERFREAVRADTGFATIMFANNEIGTIQPIAEIGEICRELGIIFHTDAVQVIGEIGIDLRSLPVDLLSISGHKIGAAKGVGAIYIRDGVEIAKFMDGGSQEKGYRAGTENTAAIAGLGVAVEEAGKRKNDKEFIKELRDKFFDGVLQMGGRIHGDKKNRLAGNANIAFDGLEGEFIVLFLNNYGICCSTGSACNAGAVEASHVIKALGFDSKKAKEAVRFTFSEENTIEEIDYILDKLKEIRNSCYARYGNDGDYSVD